MPRVGGYVAMYKSSGNAPWDAEIRCFENVTIPPGQEVAFVRFFRDAANVPADAGGAVPVVNFALDRFTEVLALFQASNHLSVDFIGGNFGVGVGIQQVGPVIP
jgi:hypothetical protein